MTLGSNSERPDTADVFDAAREVGGADLDLSSKRRSFMRRQTIHGGASVLKSWRLPEALKLSNCEKPVARELPPCNGKFDELAWKTSRRSVGGSIGSSGDFDGAAFPVAPPAEERMVHRPRVSGMTRRLTAVQTMPEQPTQSAGDAASTVRTAMREFKRRTTGDNLQPLPEAAAPAAPAAPVAPPEPAPEAQPAASRWSRALTKVVAANATAQEAKFSLADLVAAAADAEAEKPAAEGQQLRPLKRSQRDTCVMMRATLLGKVGDEHDTTGNDRNNRDTTVFDNPQGTPNESWIVWQIWNAMDTNCVGYVEAFDFIKWFSSRGKLSLAPKLWKSVSGKEDRITLLNILRSLWPRAQSDDFDAMRLVMEERKTRELNLVPAPEEMSHEQRFDLIKVFEFLDSDGSGEISMKELEEAGFMSKEDAHFNVTKFSGGKSGLDVEMFLEMMCPHGYRYSKNSTTAYADSGDGSIINQDPTDGQWYRESLPPKADRFLRSLYPERYSS